ncbi:triose-phosphate isomerase [Poseidonocella sedimentorum]|uniref:Triosephosphate isomerase n=1 Tax=Poseidonocella sedimentorum TaxID=871652 RepID=A0A1I6E8M9_9RHOB|nr:triose-phosphate isomerase [Poseidonocella sedimentorum]SFR13921.1 triosephosphate isomerase [Poseidonocella sedimentorum]
MRKLAAGNWKMNGTSSALCEAEAIGEVANGARAEVLICPPTTLLSRLSALLSESPVATGGQDCHAAASGAHTGDISADMLRDAGARYVILGHSERRTDHGETDEAVCAKVTAAWNARLAAIVCVGETGEERDAGNTLAVVTGQLKGSIPEGASAETLVVAYEPVWAIGTGRVPTTEQIGEVHDALRASLAERFGAEVADGIRLLYGGSVKGANAAEIFAVSNVDGALVGGASLKAADFGPIIQALDLA